MDYWNGLLEWTTGMDFDLFSFFSHLAKELNINTCLAEPTPLALTRAVPRDSKLGHSIFIIEIKPRPHTVFILGDRID